MLKMCSLLMEAGRSGMGMFIESYFLFSLGNVGAIWQVQYPTCYDQDLIPINSSSQYNCQDAILTSTTYLGIITLIIGMILFGFLAERLGRKWGSRSVALLMLLGGLLMMCATGTNFSFVFIMFNIGLSILSIGVGGEYPLASSSSAEQAEQADASHRGMIVGLTFSLQGWGNFVNTLCILIFVLGYNVSTCIPGESTPILNATTCSFTNLNFAWRGSYLIGVFFIFLVCLYRFTLLKESELWEERQEEFSHLDPSLRQKESGSQKMLKIIFCNPYYFFRLLGCALCWFVWDIVFYGNKLFQSTIIKVTLGGQPNLYQIFSNTLINAAVALAGYYCAAFMLDVEWMGRTRMQGMGFLLISILFLICGYAYDSLTLPSNMPIFQALYYLSTFFGQLGPNATTFLLPSELFPTDIRTITHGFSASCGKLGALVATLWFSLGGGVTPEYIFIVNGYAALIGLVLTIFLIPNTGKVSLHEVDKRWENLLLDKPYEGPAIEKHNLSLVEIFLSRHDKLDHKKYDEETSETLLEQEVARY